jgi:hypothetical protein
MPRFMRIRGSFPDRIRSKNGLDSPHFFHGFGMPGQGIQEDFDKNNFQTEKGIM